MSDGALDLVSYSHKCTQAPHIYKLLLEDLLLYTYITECHKSDPSVEIRSFQIF